MTENETKTAEQKKRDLYLRQKEFLATLLEHGAISQAQYDKSLGDLTEKMGVSEQEGKTWQRRILVKYRRIYQTARHLENWPATGRWQRWKTPLSAAGFIRRQGT